MKTIELRGSRQCGKTKWLFNYLNPTIKTLIVARNKHIALRIEKALEDTGLIRGYIEVKTIGMLISGDYDRIIMDDVKIEDKSFIDYILVPMLLEKKFGELIISYETD